MVNGKIGKQLIKIATYNIHHCADGIDNVASVIRNMDADIVGLQEADRCNERSDRLDQPAMLAERSGMGYYGFSRAIDYRGGEYGDVILSKYPIVLFETVPLRAPGFEGRCVGHAVIDVNGVMVDHFNTHLSYENKNVRADQFRSLKKMLKISRRFILTGDFNVDDLNEFDVIDAKVRINRKDRPFITYPSSNWSIDNILMSDGFEEVNARTVVKSYSDHYALLAEAYMNI